MHRKSKEQSSWSGLPCFIPSNRLSQLEIFLIALLRSWFSKEFCKEKIDRDLIIQLGYFRGCKLSKSINELFTFISVYRPLLITNSAENARLSDDEKCVSDLIFSKG